MTNAGNVVVMAILAVVAAEVTGGDVVVDVEVDVTGSVEAVHAAATRARLIATADARSVVTTRLIAPEGYSNPIGHLKTRA